MIRLIASDLDGTLLDESGCLHSDFGEVLKSLEKKKVVFAAASGRLYGTLCRNFDAYDSRILLICHNGALIQYKSTDEVLFESIMKRELITEVISFLKPLNVEIYVCSKEFAYLHKPSQEITKEFDDCDVKVKEITDILDVQEDVFRIGIFQPKGIDETLLHEIKTALGDKVGLQIGGKVWLDIINKGIDKGVALNLIQEKLHITPDETMVFGDYHNDIPMFKAAYHSYAMKNAPEEVKKHANFITESNCDNGVIKIIKEKVLNEVES